MPTVQALNIYPIKSARAVQLDSARLAATGFEWDRQWMTVDAADSFVTQRTHPLLARVVPSLGPTSLTLSAEGLASLEVPLAIEGTPVTVQIFNDTCIA